MLVRALMTPGVECISPDHTLQQAAQTMKELDVGSVPICDHDRLTGMITDRDIVLRAVAEGKDPTTTRIREAMTSEIVYCFEDQTVDEAARLMKERQIRRLVVLNSDKRLVGIVSLGDLAVDTGDEHLAGATLEAVSEPSMPRR